MKDILQLLNDVASKLAETPLHIDELSRENIYMAAADSLMNSHVIRTGEADYRICEIEFYHYNQDSYPDPYAHRDPLQKQTLGKWYCHRSGLDITFGDGSSYNGILIRAIENIKSTEYTYGPMNIRKELFASTPDITTPVGFYLGEVQLGMEEIFSARRFGLNRSKDTLGFHDLSHRFFIKKYLRHPKV